MLILHVVAALALMTVAGCGTKEKLATDAAVQDSSGGGDSGGGSKGGDGPGDTDAGPKEEELSAACKELDCPEPSECLEEDDAEARCACPRGYRDEGDDGRECMDVDECDGPNECISGETCVNVPGDYLCNCDLEGTYASLVAIEIAWETVQVMGVNVVATGEATLLTYELRRMSAQSDGQITVEVESCAGTSNVICSPFYSESYGQDFPRNLWSGLPATSVTVELPSTQVGDDFETQDTAVFLGMELPQDYREEPWPWPTSHRDQDIGWTDPDGDGLDGATSVVRHPFRNDLWMTDSRYGEADFDPVGSTAAECGNAYNYWIHPDGETRVREFHTGSRSVSHFAGTITSCDVIEGKLGGPGPGNTPIAEARITGCVKDDGAACSGSEVDEYDGVENPNQVTGACFQQVRVPDDFTCADVLEYGFDLLGGPDNDSCRG